MKNQLFVMLALAVFLGCKSGGDTQSDPANHPGPEVPTPTVQTKPKTKASPWRSALQFVGFDQSVDNETTAAPKLLGKLSDFVNTVVAKSNELSANDPPDVTRSKAKGLLDALSPWEKLRTAGLSAGVLDTSMADQLDLFVGQLRTETSKLVTLTPNRETIAGVKYLARMLDATFGTATDVVGRGSRVVQAFRRSPRR